jgi:hypothetical protein
MNIIYSTLFLFTAFLNHRKSKEETFDDTANDDEAETKALPTHGTPLSPTNSTGSSSSGSSSTSTESGELTESSEDVSKEHCVVHIKGEEDKINEREAGHAEPDSSNAAVANGPPQCMQQPPKPDGRTRCLNYLEATAAMGDTLRSINQGRYKARKVRPNLETFMLKRVPEKLPPPSTFLKPSKLNLLPNLGEPVQEPEVYANVNPVDEEDVARFFKEHGVQHPYVRHDNSNPDMMNLYPEVLVTKETPQGI